MIAPATSLTINEFVGARAAAFERSVGAKAKVTAAFRDGPKYWVRWVVALPSGETVRSVSAIMVHGSRVAEVGAGWESRRGPPVKSRDVVDHWRKVHPRRP